MTANGEYFFLVILKKGHPCSHKIKPKYCRHIYLAHLTLSPLCQFSRSAFLAMAILSLSVARRRKSPNTWKNGKET